MSDTLAKVQALALADQAVLSEHANVRLAEHDIRPIDVLAGLAAAEPLEDYPDFHKGPSVLVLRPDPALWSDDFRKRR